MTSFQQMGADSTNLLVEDHLTSFSGAVLSPVNFKPQETERLIEKTRVRRGGQFDFVFDPQLYYPQQKRGCLGHWKYFPDDFESVDRSSMRFWRSITQKVSKTAKELRANWVASPAEVPRVYDAAYFARLVSVGKILFELSDSRFEPMQSIIVSMRGLQEPNQALRIASQIQDSPCKWVYLMVETERPPRLEFEDAGGILALMQFICLLEKAGRNVFVAYASSDILLWKMAGASTCATGKYFNVRRLTASRFNEDEKDKKAGTVEYWFDEGLLAFLRQADLLRLKRDNLLSAQSERDPLLGEVLENIQEDKAWLRLSWVQFMRWFADVEKRLHTGSSKTVDLLRAAEQAWSMIDKKNVIMVDRRTTGEWITRWLQAALDFEAWRQEEEL